jgi:ERF superfamily
MNIYQKLNQAREQFHQIKMEKSGKNTFAKYDYFTLSDFIKPALKVMSANGLCATVSFDALIAKMTIVNTEKPDETIMITSPMGSALLKGCHEVQNIGAVETYQRRYLWVAALEIIEQDALDSTTERDKTKSLIIPASPKTEDLGITAERLAIVQLCAENIKALFAKNDIVGAYGERIGIVDGDEIIALNNLLDSKIRSALKTHHLTIQPKKA